MPALPASHLRLAGTIGASTQWWSPTIWKVWSPLHHIDNPMRVQANIFTPFFQQPLPLLLTRSRSCIHGSTRLSSWKGEGQDQSLGTSAGGCSRELQRSLCSQCRSKVRTSSHRSRLLFARFGAVPGLDVPYNVSLITFHYSPYTKSSLPCLADVRSQPDPPFLSVLCYQSTPIGFSSSFTRKPLLRNIRSKQRKPRPCSGTWSLRQNRQTQQSSLPGPA
jgi:hypothetical protein